MNLKWLWFIFKRAEARFYWIWNSSIPDLFFVWSHRDFIKCVLNYLFYSKGLKPVAIEYRGLIGLSCSSFEVTGILLNLVENVFSFQRAEARFY